MKHGEMVLLIILYHFTVLPAATAKCFAGLNGINIIPSLKYESYYGNVHPYFYYWGEKSCMSIKTDYYLCIGGLVPKGPQECEKSEIIVISTLFS